MGRGLLLLLLGVVLGSGQGRAHGQGHPNTVGARRGPRDAGLPSTSQHEALVPKVKPGGNLICYSCKLDFRKKDYEKNHPCLGRHENLRVSEDYAVPCGPNDTFCRVERTEVNGVLIMLRRECTDTCYPGCRLRGFGINNELCELCCGEDRCNHVYPTSGAVAVTAAAASVAAVTAAASMILLTGVSVSSIT